MSLTLPRWLILFPSTLGLFLSEIALPNSVAQANSLLQYQPPSDFPVQPILETQVATNESVGDTSTTPVRDGGRGPCDEGAIGLLTALIPAASGTQPQQWTLTSNSHPTVWFYIPEAHQVNRATFSLRSADGEQVFYNRRIKSVQPGIWSFTLPETEPGLEENMTYRVYLHLKVYPTADSFETTCGTFAFVQHRTFTSESSDIETESLATLYATNGFWLDSLNVLGQAVCNGESRNLWESLLSNEHYPGFQPFNPAIIESEIIDCTTASSQPG
ncbi:MAG: DUF928 domain-containing protein [Cyanobacteria bacterium P01_G01_bin.54]